MSSGTFENLPVAVIELDVRNPRIRRLLEHYEEDSISEDTLGLALNMPSTDIESANDKATTPRRLRESIIANGGIRQPIIVNRLPDGTLRCIEGNTRLWIYRDLDKREAEGDWSKIPSLVHDNLQGENVDAIRLQAHLVGPRPWDAYSKARYLHELQHKELMSLDRIVALCGGEQRDVTRSIQAYADMEQYYRPLCTDPAEFDPERFSGFVEFQSPKVKEAVLKHKFTGHDFADWIKDKKRIGPLTKIRQLPAVLNHAKAREVFLKSDINEALKALDKPDDDASLQGATIAQLARALESKAGRTSMEELKAMKQEEDGFTLRHVELAIDALQFLREQISVED